MKKQGKIVYSHRETPRFLYLKKWVKKLRRQLTTRLKTVNVIVIVNVVVIIAINCL